MLRCCAASRLGSGGTLLRRFELCAQRCDLLLLRGAPLLQVEVAASCVLNTHAFQPQLQQGGGGHNVGTCQALHEL